MRLGHLIGMGDAPEDTGLGEYKVIVGKFHGFLSNEVMNLDGLRVVLRQ